MRKALLVSLVFLGFCSEPPHAAALDGNVGTSSEAQAQISLTIPERFEVHRNPNASRAIKGVDRFQVTSNFADSGFKYSLKRVIFVTKDGRVSGVQKKRGSEVPDVRTQVFVVLPE